MICRIKELREAAKLTQKATAEKMNVRQSTVSMWETGEALPRSDKLPLLAKLLGCTVDDLFKDTQ